MNSEHVLSSILIVHLWVKYLDKNGQNFFLGKWEVPFSSEILGRTLSLILYFCRIKHVERANDINAIETLMVTDELFRY